MKKLGSWAAVGLALVVFFAAALPARAQDVDSRIRTLEDELVRLKTEQAQVKAEQIELKRNALAAEGALPTFSYRPGSGMLIEAADKSWSFRASLVAHFRMLFESGRSHAGRTNGEIMGRRWRPFFTYCINDCFYEMVYGIDADGFGTGNGKNATNTATGSILQRASVYMHFEQITPWLPTFSFGMDAEGAISSYRQGSSSTGSQMDYDLLSRNNGFNTGRSGQGMSVNWNDRSLEAIGIPGRIREFQMVMGTIGEGDDGLSSFKDAGSNFSFHLELEPFSQVKSKWIQGMGFEVGGWFCRSERFSTTDNGCTRLRLQDHGDGGRQTLWDDGDHQGPGWSHFFMPGFQWEIGPYRLRAVGGFQRYGEGSRKQDPLVGKTVGTNFLIGHDLYIWSPKGFFTGSATAPGSVLFGTHFERNDVDCNSGGGKNFGGSGCTGANFNRNTVLVREWDLWYFIANRMSIGVNVLWYDAKNLPTAARYNLGIGSKQSASTHGGDWFDAVLNWRYVF